jgi:hypothetical protein
MKTWKKYSSKQGIPQRVSLRQDCSPVAFLVVPMPESEDLNKLRTK